MRGPNFSKFLLNCEESQGTKTDWSFEDAVQAQAGAASTVGFLAPTVSKDLSNPAPATRDLREDWWKKKKEARKDNAAWQALIKAIQQAMKNLRKKFADCEEKPEPSPIVTP